MAMLRSTLSWGVIISFVIAANGGSQALADSAKRSRARAKPVSCRGKKWIHRGDKAVAEVLKRMVPHEMLSIAKTHFPKPPPKVEKTEKGDWEDQKEIGWTHGGLKVRANVGTYGTARYAETQIESQDGKSVVVVSRFLGIDMDDWLPPDHSMGEVVEISHTRKPKAGVTLVQKAVLDPVGNPLNFDSMQDPVEQLRLEKPLKGGGQRTVVLRDGKTKVITDTKEVGGKETTHEREYQRNVERRYILARETRDDGKIRVTEELSDGKTVKQTVVAGKKKTEREFSNGVLTALRKYASGRRSGPPTIILNETYHPLQGRQKKPRVKERTETSKDGLVERYSSYTADGKFNGYVESVFVKPRIGRHGSEKQRVQESRVGIDIDGNLTVRSTTRNASWSGGSKANTSVQYARDGGLVFAQVSVDPPGSPDATTHIVVTPADGTSGGLKATVTVYGAVKGRRIKAVAHGLYRKGRTIKWQQEAPEGGELQQPERFTQILAGAQIQGAVRGLVESLPGVSENSRIDRSKGVKPGALPEFRKVLFARGLQFNAPMEALADAALEPSAAKMELTAARKQMEAAQREFQSALSRLSKAL